MVGPTNFLVIWLLDLSNIKTAFVTFSSPFAGIKGWLLEVENTVWILDKSKSQITTKLVMSAILK